MASSWLRGYRIFFALAAGLALLWVPLWLVRWSGLAAAEGLLDGSVWHGHEMIYGYLAAALAGFLTLGDRGWRMALLGAVWLAARVLLLLPETVAGLPGTVVDLSFLPLLVVLRRPPPWSGGKPMMLGTLAVAGGLSVANAWIHAAAWMRADASRPLLLAIDLVIGLLVIVAGRLVPAHTRAFTRRGAGLTLTGAERSGIGLALGMALADAFGWTGTAAWIGGALALVQAYRLVRWWDPLILRDPLAWSLHLGFAWIPVGLVLRLAEDATGGGGRLHALHAVLVGAIGTLTVSIMVRSILGREARAAPPGCLFSLAVAGLSGAALCRAVPPLAGQYGPAWLWISGLLWTAAFALAAAACLRSVATAA